MCYDIYIQGKTWAGIQKNKKQAQGKFLCYTSAKAPQKVIRVNKMFQKWGYLSQITLEGERVHL